MDKQNYPKIDEQEQKQNQEEALPQAPGINVNEPKYELIVRNESQNTETSYLLEDGKEISVGADLECSIPVDDDYISAKHFLLKVQEEGIEVTDNNSRNSLFRKLEGSTIIQQGDTLKAGTTTFIVQERVDGQ
jgi:pSer/pThr/pTyr-binding forkhead associated (FHA) protein